MALKCLYCNGPIDQHGNVTANPRILFLEKRIRTIKFKLDSKSKVPTSRWSKADPRSREMVAFIRKKPELWGDLPGLFHACQKYGLYSKNTSAMDSIPQIRRYVQYAKEEAHGPSD